MTEHPWSGTRDIPSIRDTIKTTSENSLIHPHIDLPGVCRTRFWEWREIEEIGVLRWSNKPPTDLQNATREAVPSRKVTGQAGIYICQLCYSRAAGGRLESSSFTFPLPVPFTCWTCTSFGSQLISYPLRIGLQLLQRTLFFLPCSHCLYQMTSWDPEVIFWDFFFLYVPLYAHTLSDPACLLCNFAFFMSKLYNLTAPQVSSFFFSR